MPPSAVSKQAGARRLGVGEGALLVAEQLGLDERLRQRGAVHLDERAVAAAAGGVQRARDVALAAAGLAEQQHGRRRRTRPAGRARDALDELPQALRRRRFAEDRAGRRAALAVVRDLAPLPRAAQRLLELDGDLVELERLLHVVAAPRLIACTASATEPYAVIMITGQPGIGGDQRLEQIEPAAVGQAQVEQRDVDRRRRRQLRGPRRS